MALDTPTGMQAIDDQAELAYQPGHPQPWEWNNPIAYGLSLALSGGPNTALFALWKRHRSDEQKLRNGIA